MESLLLKDVLGMYTVQRQALNGGIIRVLQTQFSSFDYKTKRVHCQNNAKKSRFILLRRTVFLRLLDGDFPL